MGDRLTLPLRGAALNVYFRIHPEPPQGPRPSGAAKLDSKLHVVFHPILLPPQYAQTVLRQLTSLFDSHCFHGLEEVTGEAMRRATLRCHEM